MNLKQALVQARVSLTENNIEDASLEGELLLRHALGISRHQLYMELDREFSPEDEGIYSALIERRLRGEPSAYITGHREFFGLDFYVDSSVLIPRPESELLVEKAIDLSRNRPISVIADIGTGCGAIAISLSLNLPKVNIYATDISDRALEVVRINCRRHGIREGISLLQGDMLDVLPEDVDLIVANLPYVASAEIPYNGPLSFEPVLALDGGEEGVDKIYRLCYQAGSKLTSAGCLLLEIGQGQAEKVITNLHNILPQAVIEVFPDLSGLERVVSMCLTSNRH